MAALREHFAMLDVEEYPSPWVEVECGAGWEPSAWYPFVWRWLSAGRIEVRGGAERISGYTPEDGDVIARLPRGPDFGISPWIMRINFNEGGKSVPYHTGFSVETDGRIVYRKPPEGALRYPDDL